MASDSGFMSESDCDDGYSTKVSDCQLIYLKEKLAKSILDSENMSAEVQHFPGRSAKLNISFGARTNSQSHTGR